MSSDFLSGFTSENYDKNRGPEQSGAVSTAPQLTDAQQSEVHPSDMQMSDSQPIEVQTIEIQPIEIQPVANSRSKAIEAFLAEEDEQPQSPERSHRNDHTEESVKDPTYKWRKLIRLGVAAVAAIIVILLGLFLYHRWTHVSLPDFSGKNFSEARQWGSKYDITFEAKKEFSSAFEGNTVISQADQPGTKVKKGSSLQLTVSLGADPDEVVPLPDFATMSADEAQKLIDSQKLSNLNIIREFSDTKEVGQFLKLEFKDKSVTAETYRRRDAATLYFSKGKETFEKNIAVPDFNGKSKAEAEGWAKTNEIELTVKESSHDKIEEGNVINQSITAGTKVAKRDKMEITVSQGKAVTVPNYGEFGPENAAEASADMVVQVKQVLTENLPYGALVSQSIEAGTQLLGKDDKKIIVTYSIGQPYIKDLRGGMTEGELQKFFYDEFKSKGAPNISYSVVYVDSYEKKGTVVEQSIYADYLAMSSHIVFQISLGNLTAPEPSVPDDKTPAPDTNNNRSDQTANDTTTSDVHSESTDSTQTSGESSKSNTNK